MAARRRPYLISARLPTRPLPAFVLCRCQSTTKSCTRLRPSAQATTSPIRGLPVHDLVAKRVIRIHRNRRRMCKARRAWFFATIRHCTTGLPTCSDRADRAPAHRHHPLCAAAAATFTSSSGCPPPPTPSESARPGRLALPAPRFASAANVGDARPGAPRPSARTVRGSGAPAVQDRDSGNGRCQRVTNARSE